MSLFSRTGRLNKDHYSLEEPPHLELPLHPVHHRLQLVYLPLELLHPAHQSLLPLPSLSPVSSFPLLDLEGQLAGVLLGLGDGDHRLGEWKLVGGGLRDHLLEDSALIEAPDGRHDLALGMLTILTSRSEKKAHSA